MDKAICLLEVASIARGFAVCDGMVKRAPVTVLVSDTADPGKYYVIVEGDVAAVEYAHQAGREIAAGTLLGELLLANPHEQLGLLLRGEPRDVEVDSLGVLESSTIATTLLGADAAAKAAEVTLLEMGLARHLGGKGYVTMTGTLDAVEAAIEAGSALMEHQGHLVGRVVIANPGMKIKRLND
ncbi:MAG: BMC domain-containing protein [Planctomycetota bacterium]